MPARPFLAPTRERLGEGAPDKMLRYFLLLKSFFLKGSISQIGHIKHPVTSYCQAICFRKNAIFLFSPEAVLLRIEPEN
jgi:hypothetical protein